MFAKVRAASEVVGVGEVADTDLHRRGGLVGLGVRDDYALEAVLEGEEAVGAVLSGREAEGDGPPRAGDGRRWREGRHAERDGHAGSGSGGVGEEGIAEPSDKRENDRDDEQHAAARAAAVRFGRTGWERGRRWCRSWTWCGPSGASGASGARWRVRGRSGGLEPESDAK